MKKFYLSENCKKPGVPETAIYIEKYLAEHGAECVRGDRAPAGTQCVITLGGDGTIIQAARTLAGENLVFLGINMGNLGYLTQVSRQEEIAPALDSLLADDFTVEKRMMLVGSVMGKKGLSYRDICLNEIVITRKDILKVLNLRIYVNDEFLNEYTADGIIIATPTGSTAYNLSAGGPVVEPPASMVILTPICAHSLNGRSIVLSADSRIRVEIPGNDPHGNVVVFDGNMETGLGEGEWIEICRADVETGLVKLKEISFLDTLRAKMDRRR